MPGRCVLQFFALDFRTRHPLGPNLLRGVPCTPRCSSFELHPAFITRGVSKLGIIHSSPLGSSSEGPLLEQDARLLNIQKN